MYHSSNATKLGDDDDFQEHLEFRENSKVSWQAMNDLEYGILLGMAIFTMVLIFCKNDGNALYKRHAGRFTAAAIEFFVGTLMMGVFFWNNGKWFAHLDSN
jgi:hypothetical protein